MTPPYRLVSRITDCAVQYAYAGPDNCRSVYVCGGREYAQYQRPATERRIARERLWGAEDGWAPQSWGAWWWPRD